MFLKLHVIYLFNPHIKICQSPNDQPSKSLSPCSMLLEYFANLSPTLFQIMLLATANSRNR